jgi:hypothetical protein
MKNKFKPSDLKNFKENDFENLTFDEQKELASEELASKDFDMMNIKMSNNAFRSKERMQTQWSNLLMVYLVIFTISMFTTLWFNGQCGVMWIEKFCISDLNPTTLNFLITVGFAKVVGVVWIIVRHLFPDTK